MVGSRGGRSGVWWEYLGLFEKPFDAVFLLARSKVERGCEGRRSALPRVWQRCLGDVVFEQDGFCGGSEDAGVLGRVIGGNTGGLPGG